LNWLVDVVFNKKMIHITIPVLGMVELRKKKVASWFKHIVISARKHVSTLTW
jgi:hypothetical protein